MSAVKMLRSAGPSVLAPATPFLKVFHRVWGRQVSGPGAGVWGGMGLTLAALPVEDTEPLIPREELRADPRTHDPGAPPAHWECWPCTGTRGCTLSHLTWSSFLFADHGGCEAGRLNTGF